MSQIHINYDEVYAQTQNLRRHVSGNIVEHCNAEYQRIQSLLRTVDGQANAHMQQAMEANRQKTIHAASTLEKLLRFITDSARQIEINEQQIARTMSTRR